MLRKLTNALRNNRYLWLILTIGIFVRFILITENPPSLNWDEVSHGFNAYSLFKTGKDEWGETFPIIFRAYGDYKLPVYIYLTAFSEYFFGLNEFAVRLPSALAGVLTILFTYLLTKELFKNDSRITNHGSLAALAAFLIAVEPWGLFLSRGAFEANLALFFFVAGIYFFLRGLNNPKFLILNSIFFGLTVWTYNSYRVFTPLVFVVLILLYRQELKANYLRQRSVIHYSLFIILLFLLPMFWQLLNPVGQARLGKVSIVDEGAITQINEARANSNFSPIVSRAIHNKGTFFVQKFTENYFSHFSPQFLFFGGGSHYQFSVPNNGLIYWLNIPFFLLGLFVILKGAAKGVRNLLFVIVWLFFAPIPSSLTREAPHVLRSITMLPVPMIITSCGAFLFFAKLKKNLRMVTTTIYIIVVLMFLENYLINYFESYRKNYSWSWQFGYKEVVEYVKKNYNNYDKIIVTKKYGEPHEFFLFYWPWDPKKYVNDPNLIRFNQSNWYWVDGFDKFYFVNDWQIREREIGKEFVLESKKIVDCKVYRCLLITSPDNYPTGWSKLETINFLNNQPAFEIYENRVNL